MSPRFIPAAATLIKISCRFGAGTALLENKDFRPAKPADADDGHLYG